MKALLEVRRKLKHRKPKFVAQDTHKKIRIRKRWNRPRGIDSKIRLGLKGYRKKVKIGYRSPVAVRGLSREGLKYIHVYNVSDLSNIGNNEAVVLAATVGFKKKLAIVKKAKEIGVSVANIKDLDGFIKQAEEKIKKKVEEKSEMAKVKESKAKEKEKVAKEKGQKESLAEKVESEEDTAKQEKEEKDKLLIKKQ